MNITYIFNPIITPGIVATICSIAILVAIIKNMSTISQAINNFRVNLFTRTGFFWTVTLVFMAVSVLHAGAFFGISGKDDFTHYLGFAVSFFLDLVTIILMQAMLEARYRGEEGRARQFLLFIAICCATSTFANLAMSLNDFDAQAMLPKAGWLIQDAAPYVLASFPLFVILMSVAAEMIINVRPLESLDEGEYEADEKKRLKILEIRNTYLQKQADEELKTLTIRAQMKANKQANNPRSSRRFWQKKVDAQSPQIARLEEEIEKLKIELKNQLQEDYSRENSQSLQPDAQNRNDRENTEYNEAHNGNYRDEDDRQYSGPILIDQAILEVTKNYPEIASQWLSTNRKTVTINEIMEVTGHTKRRINKAPLRRSTRNAELILITSVIDWLKTAPLPESIANSNGDTPGEIPVVNSSLKTA